MSWGDFLVFYVCVLAVILASRSRAGSCPRA